MVGTATASAGYFITFFVHTFPAVFCFYGVVAGFGFGIIFTVAATLPSLYFVKYRDIANGVCMTGMGIGLLIFLPFLQVVADEYGWHGAVLILAGLVLHGFVVAMISFP